MKKQTTIFKNDPSKNPTKEPTAAFNDLCASCPATNSPTKAPTNGPIITPHGPIQKAAMKPIVHPHAPYFVPPNFLVPQIGIR